MERLRVNTIAVYRYIEQYWGENQFSPSQREIALACCLSPAGVMIHLDKLEQSGYITRQVNKPRTIRIGKPLPAAPDTTEAIYLFIAECIRNGESPSQKEIAGAFELSEQTIRTHLNRLQATGLIQRRRRVSRSIILLKK